MRVTIKSTLAILILLATAVGCSSAPRSKWTDKNMRVFLDPDSISEEHFVQIQSALVRSGKFTVVDRAVAMQAIKKEQERLHRNESDRFEDKEKWAHWGKLYGVGSIVVGHAQCQPKGSFWNPGSSMIYCKQHLAMVDSNTGEIFLAVEGENDGPSSKDANYIVPDWNEVVDKLVEAYPKSFEQKNYAGPARVYLQVSEEHAKRQKEELNRLPASVQETPNNTQIQKETR